MKIYEVEIQEFLARVVEIEAESSADAISKINEKYINSEIVLNYNDFVEVDFLDINTQSKKNEKENLIDEIIEYLSETEPENQIYKKLLRLKELNLSINSATI
jgi:Na+-transporting NADH:ubiquinone oxidoreductase subunit NqrC